MSENVFQVHINSTILLKQEDIDDIMCAAMEGGINYWCSEAEVVGEYLGEFGHEQISRGGTLRLYDAESDDTWELNLEKFLNGIQKWCLSGSAVDAINADGTIDTCQVDALQADRIVQFALFGMIVYA